MKKQPFYMFLHYTYLLHSLVLGALLYAVGGLPLFIWGMGVRVVCGFHCTLLVNSAGHIWGKHGWNPGTIGGWHFLHLEKVGTIITMLLSTRLGKV
ncbi:palmitoyl-monogalactosyldiacylglycerol delta-7 desaturase, chloroplastic-like [Prunus dulcis]|uniref:palmitoyl-monogalactosyldiacylglycerol delta-7 desaturase, chloroplastic-like n=1 Tax=Prunus dulcis TaxID=3755 RepID=UPI001482EE65|nr:palmitoyl-monogalactosyldiacylglycerol delta-7 desaturase, chloroplastic-like [Prunus dulcis]